MSLHPRPLPRAGRLILAALLVSSLGVGCGERRVSKPAAAPVDPNASPYEQALAEYRAGINRLRTSRRQMALGHARGSRAQALDRELREKGSDILDELRTSADRLPGGKLLFDGEVTENRVLDAGSSESAKLFATLLAEQRVAPGDVVRHLRMDEGPLASEWVPLLEGVVRARERGCWQTAVEVLYRGGVSREKYRPLLEQWAIQRDRGARLALEALLFVRDPNTGLWEGERSARNEALVTRLSGDGYPAEMRVVCARWAADIGDRAAAEHICTAVLWTLYRGDGARQGEAVDWEDVSLSRAHTQAMRVLYYEVRTDSAFKQVYDRAHIDREDPKRLPADFQRFLENGWARSEIEDAKALIEEMEYFNQIQAEE